MIGHGRGMVAFIVAIAGLSCTERSRGAVDPGLSRSGRMAHAEECPWYDQMPGGWCQSEYQALWDAIDFIQGDESCQRMKSTLRGWLTEGRIYKAIDFSPGYKGETNWSEWKEWPDRFNFMHINANEMWDVDKTLRHEFGHPYQNRPHPQFSEAYYEGACYGGPGGYGVLDPAPPMQ